MSLRPGARLGPYEILSPIGAGGMGEVFRARDTRLGREVAIKVLPDTVAATPERLARFEREARSASALNHPNIVTVYEFGASDSASYIAMELVRGDSLRALLLAGPLPVRRLLPIAVQIAEALAKAHASGIVHRDLKPENVMVSAEGHVKLLDFGLAKLTQAEPSGDGPAQSAAVPAATQEGMILGTVDYMSPEQATGAPVDHRSDQFSFGSILYEMATGRLAFRRASAPQTLTSIIQDEPEPIATRNPGIPPPLRWTVQRCLAKEPRNRYASTEDLARELETIRENLSEASGARGALDGDSSPAPRRRRALAAAITAGILLAVAARWMLRSRLDGWTNPLAGARFQRLTDWEGSEVDAAISSDGKFVAFLSDRTGPFEAWVMQVGSDQAVNLSNSQLPQLYADRIRNIGFAGDDAHVWLRVNMEGGTPDPTRDPSDIWLAPTLGGDRRPFLTNASSIAWSADRSRLVYHWTDPGDPLIVADRDGADRKRIFVGEPGHHNHYPVWSPDGRYIYFARGLMTPLDMDIWRVPSGGGVAERLTNHHSRVAYPTFVDERTLLYTASRPDGSGSGLYGIDVERRVPHAVSFGLEEYLSVAASADGRRLVATVASPTSHLWRAPITDHLVDESGVSRVALPAVRVAAPRWGPDFFLYLSSKGGANGLWKFKDNAATELWKASQGSVATAPAVSADGSQISFVVRDEGQTRLYVMASDGTGLRRIAESLESRDAPSWSPDGKWIAAVAAEGREQPLFKVPAEGGVPVRLAGGINYNPVWSPDGRVIVYSETRGGPSYLLKAVTPEGEPVPMPEIRVFLGGNRYRFLPRGEGLVIMMGQGRRLDFWLLDIASRRRRQLTELRPGYDMRSFDVSPDGKEILFDRFRENSDVVLIDRTR